MCDGGWEKRFRELPRTGLAAKNHVRLQIISDAKMSPLQCKSYIQSLKKGYIPPDFLIYVLVCTAQTTMSMETNDIPLKSPIKLQQEMQKNNF